MSDTDSDSSGSKTVRVVEKRSSDSESSYEDATEPSTLVQRESERKAKEMYPQQPQPRRKRFVPKFDIEGVCKVVLGEETQILVEMCIGPNVNSQYPWKFVNKEKILESIDIAGENSEFFLIKDKIQAYAEEMILMGYIADESKDVDEFYLCYTIEAKDHCKQQSDKFIRRQEKKLEKAVQKKPRPWTSLGSEIEITELLPVNTRPLIELEIKTKFPTVYQPDKFRVRDTSSAIDGYIELTPYRVKYNNIFRRRIDTASQAAPSKVTREAQTDLKYPKNMWTQSIADALGKIEVTEDTGVGGVDELFGDAPEEEEMSSDDEEKEEIKVDPDDPGLIKYRTALKRMRRPSYIKNVNNFVLAKTDEMDDIVELNTVMDVYCNDYPKLVAKNLFDIYDSMTFEEYVCFIDVRSKDKYVSSVIFHPMWTGIVAISFADGSPNVMKSLTVKPDPIKRAVYGLNSVMIWSHIDSLLPKLYLESPREVKVLSFCPFEENILLGGCVNGQIILWDLTNKLDNVEKNVVLSETKEKYHIAMNAHMGWMKNVQDVRIVQYTALSNLMTSHFKPVTGIRWLSPNFSVSTTGREALTEKGKKSLIFLTASEDGNILIWNMSIENVAFESKAFKKSRRILRRPSGLMVDVSPLKVLDRNLQPIYKVILSRVGQPESLPVQSFDINGPVIEYVYIPRKTGTGRKYFITKIIPETENDMSRVIYCGSMHGELRRVSWDGHDFNTGELINSEYCDIKYFCKLHDGLISTTAKSPFINYITMTVGGNIFAIWSDHLVGRPLIWKKRPCRLTDVAWSRYKASIFFIATADGTLETWDLLLRSDEPISVQTLSGTMLTGVSLHPLPLEKNILGVSDGNGSFRMFLYPPIFMIENKTYTGRTESLLNRELNVLHSFAQWQSQWHKQNPYVQEEIKRKEAALLIEKEEMKRKEREEEDKRIEHEAEARRLEKMKVIGPKERWEMIINKLIEKTIAIKKRINRAELIEDERPLRELEIQRLEKERRMLEIMKNQKSIFNDTVAILFPEAIKKEEEVKKSYLSTDRHALKQEFLDDYDYLKNGAIKLVSDNPYQVIFSWEATLTEGRERRVALNAYESFIKLHKRRLIYGETQSTLPLPLVEKKNPESELKSDEEETSD